MIQSKEFRELCKEVQKEFPDLTVDAISTMVKDQFLFAQQHISQGSLTPIYFQYLGRFRAKEGRVTWLKNRKKEQDDINKQRELHGKGDPETSPEE